MQIKADTKLEEITGEGIIVANNSSGQELIKADTVILATGLRSNNELYNSLVGKVPRLYAIGDCREPRNIMGAVWDAYELASSI